MRAVWMRAAKSRAASTVRSALRHPIIASVSATLLAAALAVPLGLADLGGGEGAPTPTPAGARMESGGFGTEFGRDSSLGGRVRAAGQTLPLCPDEPLIGWVVHGLPSGSGLIMRWRHEGIVRDSVEIQVGTRTAYFRLRAPVSPGQYTLEAEAASSGVQGTWGIHVESLPAGAAECTDAEPS